MKSETMHFLFSSMLVQRAIFFSLEGKSCKQYSKDASEIHQARDNAPDVTPRKYRRRVAAQIICRDALCLQHYSY